MPHVGTQTEGGRRGGDGIAVLRGRGGGGVLECLVEYT